jgi:hypothetical protein
VILVDFKQEVFEDGYHRVGSDYPVDIRKLLQQVAGVNDELHVNSVVLVVPAKVERKWVSKSPALYRKAGYFGWESPKRTNKPVASSFGGRKGH